MPGLDTVLIKVASRCNIACDYCYVYKSRDLGWTRMPRSMSLATIDSVVNSLGDLYLDQGRDFATVLHGGEPLLLGRHRMVRLLTGLRQRLPETCTISIQTNGTLITNELLDLCSLNSVTLSVSLDGPESVNDLHRRGFSQQTTFKDTLEGIRKLQAHRDGAFLFTGVLSVIDATSCPAEVYRFFKEISAPSLNFLLPDGNHSKLPLGKASPHSTEYGEWLTELWKLYASDPQPIPIRTIDNIAKLIMGGRASKEGMGTTDYSIAIIDTDGSISKNDTLKSSHDGADRFEERWSVFAHRLSDIARSSVFMEYVHDQKPTNRTCQACCFLDICGGGMPLYRWRDGSGYDNPSVYCDDHKMVIGTIGQDILATLKCNP
jgi:uncharacterized protein